MAFGGHTENKIQALGEHGHGVSLISPQKLTAWLVLSLFDNVRIL